MEETRRNDIVIETLAGSLACSRDGDLSVRCDMGAIRADWRSVPLAEDADTLHLPVGAGPLQDAVALSVGNPHAVYFVANVDGIDLAAFAPDIQRHRLFPEEVNVGIAQVVDTTRLRVRVYERGAGLTMACGSGACAAVYAAHKRGLIKGREAVVSMPAGEVVIRLREDAHVDMSGPVAYCYSGFL
jgi:diaminopimelate epimerase